MTWVYEIYENVQVYDYLAKKMVDKPTGYNRMFIAKPISHIIIYIQYINQIVKNLERIVLYGDPYVPSRASLITSDRYL